MIEHIETKRDKKLHQLHHDIQNCLNVISMGTDALAQSRDDAAIFDEFHKMVRENRIWASNLVNEFFNTACDECE